MSATMNLLRYRAVLGPLVTRFTWLATGVDRQDGSVNVKLLPSAHHRKRDAVSEDVIYQEKAGK
jgi:hypothetical protein